MIIRYENNIEDLVTWSRYYCDHSPIVRRARMRTMWTVPILFSLVCVFTPMLLELSIEEKVGGGILAVLFSAYWPWVYSRAYRRAIDRQIRKLYLEGSSSGILCEHELELTDDFLIERSPNGETRSKLQSIHKVITDGDYTYIYINSFSAHVVPQDGVSYGKYEAFIKRIRQVTAKEEDAGLS